MGSCCPYSGRSITCASFYARTYRPFICSPEEAVDGLSEPFLPVVRPFRAGRHAAVPAAAARRADGASAPLGPGHRCRRVEHVEGSLLAGSRPAGLRRRRRRSHPAAQTAQRRRRRRADDARRRRGWRRRLERAGGGGAQQTGHALQAVHVVQPLHQGGRLRHRLVTGDAAGPVSGGLVGAGSGHNRAGGDRSSRGET